MQLPTEVCDRAVGGSGSGGGGFCCGGVGGGERRGAFALVVVSVALLRLLLLITIALSFLAYTEDNVIFPELQDWKQAARR